MEAILMTLGPMIVVLGVLFLLGLQSSTDASRQSQYSRSINPHIDDIDVKDINEINYHDYEKDVEITLKILGYGIYGGPGCSGGSSTCSIILNKKYEFLLIAHDMNDCYFTLEYIDNGHRFRLQEKQEFGFFSDEGKEQLKSNVETFTRALYITMRDRHDKDINIQMGDAYFIEKKIYEPLLFMLYAHSVLDSDCKFILDIERLKLWHERRNAIIKS